MIFDIWKTVWTTSLQLTKVSMNKYQPIRDRGTQYQRNLDYISKIYSWHFRPATPDTMIVSEPKRNVTIILPQALAGTFDKMPLDAAIVMYSIVLCRP